MKKAQLQTVMIFHLKNFAGKKRAPSIDETTVHNTVLRDNDGIGTANSKRIYKSFVRFTRVNAGFQEKTWPANWMDMSVSDLAEKLAE